MGKTHKICLALENYFKFAPFFLFWFLRQLMRVRCGLCVDTWCTLSSELQSSFATFWSCFSSPFQPASLSSANKVESASRALTNLFQCKRCEKWVCGDLSWLGARESVLVDSITCWGTSVVNTFVVVCCVFCKRTRLQSAFGLAAKSQTVTSKKEMWPQFCYCQQKLIVS